MTAVKTRVLAIAPYEEMKEQLERIAGFYEDIELTVFVGDLGQGAEIAKSNFHADYDVILSRGGTAKLIQSMVPLPVIEIGISLYDILCAFNLAISSLPPQSQENKRMAVVGFDSITKNAYLLCEVLNFDLDVYTIESTDMVKPILQRLKQSGCPMVLCDMVANTTATQLGLNTYLINSGTDSIRAALDQVRLLAKSHDALLEENHFLRKLLLYQGTNTVVFDDSQKLFFSSLPEDAESDVVLQMLHEEIEATQSEVKRKILRNKKGIIYTIFARRIHTLHHHYIAFFFTTRQALPQSNRCGIRFPTKKEVEEFYFNSIFSVSGALDSIKSTFEGPMLSGIPLMIVGEDGSGKQQAMNGLYLNSIKDECPLVNINCELLSEKTWDFLLDNSNSPLCDTGNILHFHNVDALSREMAHELIASLQVMAVCKNNRVLFSCTRDAHGGISSISRDFVRGLDTILVPLPALREHAETIPYLVSIYLNRINPQLEKQVAGIAPDGMALLQCYSWPHNYTQFKRVLRELAIIAKGPIVSGDEIRAALVKEKSVASISMRALDSAQPIDLTRTLAEIEKEVVQRVLKDMGNNQTLAAKRLGISRTTLWRMTQTP